MPREKGTQANSFLGSMHHFHMTKAAYLHFSQKKLVIFYDKILVSSSVMSSLSGFAAHLSSLPSFVCWFTSSLVPHGSQVAAASPTIRKEEELTPPTPHWEDSPSSRLLAGSF